MRFDLRLGLVLADLLAAVVNATPASASSYQVVHSFTGSDGMRPAATLINVGGTLYGTTLNGGAGACPNGCGTVFSVNLATGAETVVYAFKGGTDGISPHSSLVNVGGTLYGTTLNGGTGACSSGCGTVFGVSPATGVETLRYSLKGAKDSSSEPAASLINVGGILYGTTGGGANDDGTEEDGSVFALNPRTDTKKILHIFIAGGTDGETPEAGLIKVGDIFYGTTTSGGTGTCEFDSCGAVFALNPKTGVEAVVYSFTDQGNGVAPFAGLIEVAGSLYGTTLYGGGGSCSVGCGVVYAVNPSTGVERVVHVFAGSGDGAEPFANLIDVGGKLYGTASRGGGDYFQGTIFVLNPRTNTLKVLHSFKGSDGSNPAGGLVYVDGTFYGTTLQGGTGCPNDGSGCGTVFSLIP